MNDLLIVGDVHGCLDTFQQLLTDHWHPERERLIQLGDLIDRGPHSPETVAYCRHLAEQYGERAIFLKGNHEFELLTHFNVAPNDNWLRQCGHETLRQYEERSTALETDCHWFATLPLYWSNDDIFISHAGIAIDCSHPFDEDAPNGVLWNRTPLQSIGKVQVVGHTPRPTPLYEPTSTSWHIDTGAGHGGSLTALRLRENGTFIELISLSTT